MHWHCSRCFDPTMMCIKITKSRRYITGHICTLLQHYIVSNNNYTSREDPSWTKRLIMLDTLNFWQLDQDSGWRTLEMRLARILNSLHSWSFSDPSQVQPCTCTGKSEWVSEWVRERERECVSVCARVYIEPVNTIPGVSTSYFRVEADATAGPFLTIPVLRRRAFMETTVTQARRRAAQQTANRRAIVTKGIAELHYTLAAFNMVPRKLRLNCPIFILASRQGVA